MSAPKYTYSHKYKEPASRKKIKKIMAIIFSRNFWIALLFLSFISSSIYFLFFYSYFEIKNIEIKGNQRVSSGEVKDIANEQLNKTILFASAKNVFLSGFVDINRKITDRYIFVSSVKITKILPSSLLIEITERVPVARVCHNSECFNADKDGFVFEKSNNDNIPRFELDSMPKMGATFIDKKYFAVAMEIAKEMNKNPETAVYSLKISADTEKITAKTIIGWEAYFDTNANISGQLENLRAILSEKVPTEKKSNLEYIDLRFNNQVYFRYKGEGIVLPPTEVETASQIN